MPTMEDLQEDSLEREPDETPDSDAPEKPFRIKWFLSTLPKAAILIGAIALIADVLLIARTYNATQKALATYAFLHADDPEPVVVKPVAAKTYSMSLTCKNCLTPYQHKYPVGTPVTLDHGCPVCGVVNQGFKAGRGKAR